MPNAHGIEASLMILSPDERWSVWFQIGAGGVALGTCKLDEVAAARQAAAGDGQAYPRFQIIQSDLKVQSGARERIREGEGMGVGDELAGPPIVGGKEIIQGHTIILPD